MADGTMNLTYHVTTDIGLDGVIAQEVYSVFQGKRETIMRSIVDTREAQLVAALVKLGWTPPPEWKHRSPSHADIAAEAKATSQSGFPDH